MNFFNNIRWKLLGAALGFFLLASLVSLYYHYSDDSAAIASKLENKLNRKEQIAAKLIESLQIDQFSSYIGTPSLFNDRAEKVVSTFAENNIILLIYRNNSLAFWTDNRAVPLAIDKIKEGVSFVKLGNGWYELIRYNRKEDRVYICLIPVKYEYELNNRFLENSFSPDLEVPEYFTVKTDSVKNGVLISSDKGILLFSIIKNTEVVNDSGKILLVVLCLLGILAFAAFVNELAQYYVNHRKAWSGIGILVSFILLSRYFTLEFHIPAPIYTLDIFSPSYYASNFLFASLGDFFVNNLLILWLVYFCYSNLKNIQLKVSDKLISYISCFLFILLLYFFVDFINGIFRGLILDSRISFDVTNLLSLTGFSYIGFLNLGIVVFTFYLLCETLLAIINGMAISVEEKGFIFLISFCVFFAYKLLDDSLDMLLLTTSIYIIYIDRIRRKNVTNLSFPNLVAILLIFAFAASPSLYQYNSQKEQESRKLIAARLESMKDPVAEYLFIDIEQKLKTDTFLINELYGSESTVWALMNRIRELYFGGYLSKFELRLNIFDSNGNPLYSELDSTSFKTLDGLTRNVGQSTLSSSFFHLQTNPGTEEYIAKIPIYGPVHGKKATAYLGCYFIRLSSKLIRPENAFPELLLEGNIPRVDAPEEYSFAFYKKGKLVNKQGDYPYGINFYEFRLAGKEYNFIESNNYDHLVFRPDDTILIVVSRKVDSLFKSFATFSYIFGFISIMLILLHIWRRIYLNFILRKFDIFKIPKLKLPNFSFSTRIQISVVAAVVGSSIIIGAITYSYITSRYRLQQGENIKQKLDVISTALENQLSNPGVASGLFSDRLKLSLASLSNDYKTDINLYDSKGTLLVSTQPRIIERGLLSAQMNVNAYLQVKSLGKTQYISDEQVGKLNYISAYAPLRNKENKVEAYVGLPFFDNNNEYNSEVSYFLNALINVYSLVFIFIGFFAFFIANSLTAPLALIENYLKTTFIGKKNQPIEWKGDDEIGTLVKEYNRMITALEDSADLLARSEREGAWREMAKQVAHEIKNPLTPLKLGMQLLERSWNEKDPYFDEKFKRFNQTFNQQVDSLSTIATEFSNFAKMPLGQGQAIDIVDVLTKVVDLFKEEHSHIGFNHPHDLKALVFADHDQMIRIFTNIIKNAVQAIPENKVGIIDVELAIKNNMVFLVFQDNGIGISQEQKNKIFTPNFTTKNSGTGLGLAMCKNMVEAANGKIWFNSVLGVGTTFYISFPLYSEK